MKADKDSGIKTFWKKWGLASLSLKNIFTFTILLLVFALALVFIWKRYTKTEQKLVVILPQKFSPKDKIQELIKTTTSLQTQLTSLSNRLTVTETKNAPQGLLSQGSDQLISLELLRGVLEGLIPLETLKRFLQKNPNPWKTSFLATLASLGEIKSYSQLEALLSCPPQPASQPLSLWQRIKRKIKSLIHVQKIDDKGHCKLEKLDDLQKALQNHDMQKTLEAFEKLFVEEKAHLASWKKLAQDRLAIEKIEKSLLLLIAGESDA